MRYTEQQRNEHTRSIHEDHPVSNFGLTLGASAQNAASETLTVSSTQSATMQSPPPGAIAGHVGQPNITSVLASQENVSMLVDVLGKDRFSDLYDEITSRLVSFTLLAPSN